MPGEPDSGENGTLRKSMAPAHAIRASIVPYSSSTEFRIRSGNQRKSPGVGSVPVRSESLAQRLLQSSIRLIGV